VGAFGPKLGPALQQQASAAAVRGKTPAEIREMLRQSAQQMLGAGGVTGATRTEAGRRIAEDQAQDLQARIIAAQANLPPRRRGKDGGEEAARRQALQLVAAEDRRKAAAARTAQQTDAFTEATAQSVFQNPQWSGGVQFTPDQARAVAWRAVATVGKEGNLASPESQMAALQQAIEAELQEMRQAFGAGQAAAPRRRGEAGFRSIAPAGPMAMMPSGGAEGGPDLAGTVNRTLGAMVQTQSIAGNALRSQAQLTRALAVAEQNIRGLQGGG
jgi:hypothetical protein